jgi:hypothetical protein
MSASRTGRKTPSFFAAQLGDCQLSTAPGMWRRALIHDYIMRDGTVTTITLKVSGESRSMAPGIVRPVCP